MKFRFLAAGLLCALMASAYRPARSTESRSRHSPNAADSSADPAPLRAPDTPIPQTSTDPGLALSSAATVIVETVAFGTGISSASILGRADSFEASVGTLYFWNRVSTSRPPTRIKHVWYHGDKKAAEYAIELSRRRSRLWTRKSVQPGLWRVEVLGADGEPLMVSTCIVRHPRGP